MQKAEVFMCGDFQAIRLPKSIRLDTDVVFIQKEQERLYLMLDDTNVNNLSFKELMQKNGLSAPQNDDNSYEELFGEKRQLRLPRAVKF
ncbi:MAG: hypothetical protein FWE37_09505 [Spirochaetaceae bacterium]|nr:hypothetical protein [Spirochaetaceae bacterium]